MIYLTELFHRIPDIVLTINALGVLGLFTWWAGRNAFDKDSTWQKRLFLGMLIILAIKIVYVAWFAAYFPERVMETDGRRYAFEMRGISEEPWRWNPWSGTGPYGYAKTAKMGMSYIYGVLLFLHGTSSLYAILVLNVFFGALTCLAVFKLCGTVASAPTVQLASLYLAGIHPEMLFWNGKIVRENLTLMMVPVLFYSAIKLKQTHRLHYFVFLLITAAGLALVRAQLVLFVVMIVAYDALLLIRQKNWIRSLCILLLSLGLVYLLGDLAREQISRAVGSAPLRYLKLDPLFWWAKIKAAIDPLPSLLSLAARQKHGVAGLFLAPFVGMVFALFLVAVIRFRRVFAGRTHAAGLLIVSSVAFILVVASSGLINIRFRATIAPLIIPVVVSAAGYLWREFKLPRLTFHSCKQNPANQKVSVLRLVLNIGETNAPYNQFSLAAASRQHVTIVTYFPVTINVPGTIRLLPGDGTVRGFLGQLRNALSGVPFDVVHAHSPHVALLFLWARIFWIRKLPPAIFTFHNSYPNFHWRNRIMLYPVFAGFDRMVCCGLASRKSVPPLLGWIGGRRIVAIQNAMDIARLDRVVAEISESNRKDPGVFKVVVIGRLVPIKEHACAMEAFIRSAIPNSILYYIGEGPQATSLQALAAERLGQRTDQQIVFTGLLARDEVYRTLVQADLYVSASRGEGLPIAVLEAMACGLPVILSDIEPHREIAGDQSFIPLVPVGDVNGFADRMRRVYEMPEGERAISGARCRDIVLHEFGLARMLAEYENLYLTLRESP